MIDARHSSVTVIDSTAVAVVGQHVNMADQSTNDAAAAVNMAAK